MRGCFGGCLGRVAALVLLAVLIAAAWRFGPEIAERFAWPGPAGEEPSVELAEAALDRLATLLEGDRDEVSLDAVELESLIRFTLAAQLPPGVEDPTVQIRDGEIRLGLLVPLELIPQVPELESVRSMLPDRVPVELRGALLTLDGGDAVFLVRRIDAVSVPIPRRFHAQIVETLDPRRSPSLPAEAITIPLPDGVRSLHLEGDRLVVRGTH